ncbi:MAG: hypothetical protein NTV58_06345 [Deltaproteobacteria bacterium]|nr:hypothetical protein [Deltaproteobacteria bacterium]
MKTEKSARTIPPVFPTDNTILEVKNEDGSIDYRYPAAMTGGFDVCEEDLRDRITAILERFKILAAMLYDYDEQGIGYVYNALVEHAQHEIYEIFHFMDEAIGAIECTTIAKNYNGMRQGRCVAVTIKPKEVRHAA